MNKAGIDSVTFASLLDQGPDVIERIRQLRNEPSVRKYMYSDHEISPTEHQAWLVSLRGNPYRRIWAVLHHDQVEGLVSLSEISPVHKSAEWAFYLSPNMQGKGIGGVVEFKLLDIAFGEMGLEKLNCEVLVTNPRVIELHQKFGFTLEGVRRANVVKDGQRLDVVLLGVQLHEWQEKRPRFARLYAAQ